MFIGMLFKEELSKYQNVRGKKKVLNKMTHIQKKCGVCGEVISGIGYEMPSKSLKHLQDEHKEDWLKIDELEVELRNIKDKYNLYLYGTY